MKSTRNFDKKNFDEFIAGFIGETLIRGKRLVGNTFDGLLAVCQICQTYPLSNVCTVQYSYTVKMYFCNNYTVHIAEMYI